jgi:hypothetical protein
MVISWIWSYLRFESWKTTGYAVEKSCLLLADNGEDQTGGLPEPVAVGQSIPSVLRTMHCVGFRYIYVCMYVHFN